MASSEASSDCCVWTLLQPLKWKHRGLVSITRRGPWEAALIMVQIQVKIVLKRWDGLVGWERWEQSVMDQWAALLNMQFSRTNNYEWRFDSDSSWTIRRNQELLPSVLSSKNWIMATANDVTYLCARISDYHDVLALKSCCPENVTQTMSILVDSIDWGSLQLDAL